jgi:RNase H-fold protein (predicted Holliday junction resolvase)
MKVVSIDPGTKNLGFAVWEDGKFTEFGSYNILEMVQKKHRTDYSYVVKAFVEKTQLFKNADVVLVEHQMQARMKMIACSIRCFFWEKSKMISPLAVRKHFKISNGVYKKNKSDSKIFVHRLLTKQQSEEIVKSKKHDDIADALIQLQFYLEKNNLLYANGEK